MKDEIDYTEKISTFNLLVGNTNEEVALNYLTLTNWDENQAAILYNKENKGADAKLINTNNNIINPNINQNPDYIPVDYYSFGIIKPYINNISHKKNSKLDKYPECKIYKKGFFDGFKIWNEDNRGYFVHFKDYKNCMKYYDGFISNIKTKVGIIYIYDKKAMDVAINVFRDINNNEQTKDILSQRCVIHPMVNKCFEAPSIIKKFKIVDLPVMIICLYKNEENLAVIQIINNIMSNIELLNKKILEAQELLNDGKKNYSNQIQNNTNNLINKNNINNNPPSSNNNNVINNINNINNTNNIINNININNNIINNNPNNNNNSKNILDDPRNYMFDDDIIKDKPNQNIPYPYMSDGEILQKQEEDMKSLERIEEEKIKKKKREEEEKKKAEEEKIKKQEEEKQKIESLIKQLPEEPNDDDPNKCTIMFRFPDGEKTVQRKFLKNDKISLLYIYVKSLGKEIYNDPEEEGFSLVQPFPFKNFNDLQDNTLEQEGMFPNAVLQIRTVE